MTVLEVALDYIGRGWNPVPCNYKSKKPIGDEWQHRIINAGNAARYFNNNPQNIGAQMGPKSNGLSDADLDSPEAVALASYILPPTGAIFGRASARMSHRLYITNLASVVDDACLTFDDPNAKQNGASARIVELRVGGGDKGAQTVFPGSVHESGEPVQWEENGDPAVVDGADLIRRIRLVAAATLIVRAWPAKDSHVRHDAALTLGGFLARAGLSETDIKVIVQAITRAAGDEEWKDRVRAAQDHAQHHAQTGSGRGFPSLVELTGDKAAKKIAEWLDYSGADRFEIPRTPGGEEQRPSNHSWDEPDISLLDDRRGELPDFPLDTLCSVPLQDWITRAAHGSGTSVAHVAVPLLGIASSLIGTARRVQASRSFIQPMTCWTALVGFSGSGKTPGIDATKRALAVLERSRKHKIAHMQRAHEAKAETAKIVLNKWKADLKAAIETDEPHPPKPPDADDLGKFVTPRLFVSDATIEKIGVLLQARPQGMLMLADELAGLFLNMSRYTTGQDNEFWLECWNGNPYVIERMARPSILLDYLLVGMVGGLQPDKLAAAFQGDQDGMYARMLFAWPDEQPYQPLTNLVGEVEPEIVNALERLCSLGEQGELVIRTIPLAPDSVDVLEQLRQHMFAAKAAFEGRERDWWAKLPAHVLRLAGTGCYLSWAMTNNPEPTTIDAQFMQAAVRLVRDYFWPHARAALRQIGLTEQHVNARRTLRWIKTAGLVEVSREDIRRDALAQALDADDTQALLDRLERAGWLRKTMSKPTGPAGGRPVYRWLVNPQLMR